MYRIFINENQLILSSSESQLEIYESLEVQYYKGRGSITKAIKRARNYSIIIFGEDLEIMWRDFCSHYQIIEASGGVILNDQGFVLWIFRNGKWDLPKGKVEIGESLMIAAQREVEEECAVKNISLGSLLGRTYHTYDFNGLPILKISHWFAMTCGGEQSLKPQIKEGITKAIWADSIQYRKCLTNTYSSISELLNREKVLNYLGF
jgi:8-oxo-dGTP pyrophosphatase MutT (NUDIX family)